MNGKALSSATKILALFVLSTINTQPGIASQLKIVGPQPGNKLKLNSLKKMGKNSSKPKPVFKVVTKETQNVVGGTADSGEYVDGIFLRKESKDCESVYKKLLYGSYDAKINAHVRNQALVNAFMVLPIPSIKLVLDAEYGGVDGKPALLQSRSRNRKQLESGALSIEGSAELGSLVLGPAQFFLAQAVANSEAEVANHDAYYEACKTVQAYLNSLRKFRVHQEQEKDFAIENREAQARHKVGTYSTLTAIQLKARYDVAKAQKEESYMELVIGRRALNYLTPHLKEEDFEKLEQLSSINFDYRPVDLEEVDHCINTPMTRKMRLKMRQARTNELFQMTKSILPVVGVKSHPFQDGPLSPNPHVNLSASWTLGVKNASETINGIIDSHKIAAESAKQITKAEEGLRTAARKYNMSIKLLELTLVKVDSALKKLQCHEGMDQADPEVHVEKRTKYKEELYTARFEAEKSLERVALSYLEYMYMSGRLLDKNASITSIQNRVVRYNHSQKRDIRGAHPSRNQGPGDSGSLLKKPVLRKSIGDAKAVQMHPPAKLIKVGSSGYKQDLQRGVATKGANVKPKDPSGRLKLHLKSGKSKK